MDPFCREGKSPLNGEGGKKAPSMVRGKAPSMVIAKAPSDYLPCVLLGVVGGEVLRALLKRHNQAEWASYKRMAGLLTLIDLVARRGPEIFVSSELSREYVSTLKRAKNRTTIRQPLALLVEIGILEIVQKASVGPHRKTSARYRISSKFGKVKKVEVWVTAQQRSKMENAETRKNARLNKNHPFRRQLGIDLQDVGLSEAGRAVALKMMIEDRKVASIRRLMGFLDGEKVREIAVDPCGTIHTFARLIPKELKAHVTIKDQPVAICDIEAAHICVLSCVLQERINWLGERSLETEEIEIERQNFIGLLASADVYEHLARGSDRGEIKKALLSSINMPTSKASHIKAYRRFKEAFPVTVGVIEDIKSRGHRGISRPLQHYTARIIANAMCELHTQRIPCIPDTDALIVPKSCESVALGILNRSLLDVTGISRQTI